MARVNFHPRSLSSHFMRASKTMMVSCSCIQQLCCTFENFLDRNLAGQHCSQLLPWSYTMPTPVLEPSVMTQTGSSLLKSTGFSIGALAASALILSKHLSSRGVYWKALLLWAAPDNGVVYAVMSGINCARYWLVQGNFGLHCNSEEFSILGYTASYLIQHVCPCRQWHGPNNRHCLKKSLLWTWIGRNVLPWVRVEQVLCALCVLWVNSRI